MIEVDDFSFTYEGAAVPALQNINLHVEKGEAVLIQGASGSGKSTLLYCLNGLIPHVIAGATSGEVCMNGMKPGEKPIREISQTVGIVFQNPESQIFMMRVQDDVAFGCENLMMTRDEIIRCRDEALHAMGLWELRHRETFKLSGGQKQRLAISSIYAMGSRIFLFDEPTTDLDDAGRQDFFNIIHHLKGQGKTVVLVEHQYEEYLPLMDRVVNMDSGRIIEKDQSPIIPPLVRKTRIAPSETVIKLDGISFAYDKGKDIVTALSLEIHRGEIVALLGNNGSGKTTLLKIIGGLLRPCRGKIAILNLAEPKLESIVGRVGFLFQNPDEQLFAGTVEEEVAFGQKNLGRKGSVTKYLEMAGLSTYGTRHPQMLSRGQRQLLAVISVMAMEPEVLVLDEPTTGLDSRNWHQIFNILNHYADRGGSVIFSTHNRQAANAAGRRITLDKGRIVKDEIS